MFRRCAGITLLVGLVLGLSLAVTSAGAGKGEVWKSRVKLRHPRATVFKGTVGSKLKACRDERLVKVNYTDPNTGQTQPLSVQRSGGRGRFQVNLANPAFAGKYRAKVTKRRIGSRTCRGTKSKALIVSG